MTRTYPLEAHTRTKIDTRLANLGWILDEKNPDCNVFQEQPKTTQEKEKLEGVAPDYVLYDGDHAIAIIEAKRPGETLDQALEKAVKLYAKKLTCPLVFASNDTFVQAVYVSNGKPLKIDGEEIQDFIDQHTALRFINEGAEILSAPQEINVSREELLRRFKEANNILREEGLRNGYERFSAFADVLFLKLFDESEKLREHQKINRILPKKYSWSYFTERYKNDKEGMLDYIKDSVWVKLKGVYGNLFKNEFGIRKGSTLEDLIGKLDFNLTSTDVDVKGDSFEFFLKNVTNGNKDLGEYYTPRHVTRTCVHLIKPKFGEKIYDPFCGTGGFLVEAFKYLKVRIAEQSTENLEILKEKTIFGRDFTSTARIAQMNLIMFDDGYSNIQQIDSLENPVNEEYDVILTNIPYSQSTKFGGLYDIPTPNGDSVCLQHVFKALKPTGRAAVIVPETFLYEDGKIGETRKLIFKGSKKVSIISLPRGVFLPYTPTKTNILYFEKGKKNHNTFFFVVKNDGFELNTKRKSKVGSSDLKKLLSVVDEPENKKAVSAIVDNDTIVKSGNYNLRPFYYMEDNVISERKLIYLEGKVKECHELIDPREDPDSEFKICEVSQQGVFLGSTMMGSEFTQKYKVVNAGELAYNPYRINIGSIGIIPPYLDRCLVSPAYVVFTSISEIPNEYILSILKHKRFQEIIMEYSLGSARANMPLEELERIMIPKPNEREIIEIKEIGQKLKNSQIRVFETNQQLESYHHLFS